MHDDAAPTTPTQQKRNAEQAATITSPHKIARPAPASSGSNFEWGNIGGVPVTHRHKQKRRESEEEEEGRNEGEREHGPATAPPRPDYDADERGERMHDTGEECAQTEATAPPPSNKNAGARTTTPTPPPQGQPQAHTEATTTNVDIAARVASQPEQGQVISLLHLAIANQQNDKAQTVKLFDHITDRLDVQQNATTTIIQRLEQQDATVQRHQQHTDAKLAHIDAWGLRMQVTVSTIDTRLQTLEEEHAAGSTTRTDEMQQHITRLEQQQQQQQLREERTAAVTKATTAAATAAASTAATNCARPAAANLNNEFVLIIAGFGKDRQGEVIERISRQILGQTRTAPALVTVIGTTSNAQERHTGIPHSNHSPSTLNHILANTAMARTASTLRCHAPWLLGSAAHIATPNERVGRQLLAEIKTELRRHAYTWPGQPDTPLPLWAGVQKTREERLRNKRLTTMTACIQTYLHTSSPDTAKEPHQATCWKSATTVLGGRRIATLRRVQLPGAPAPPQTGGCRATTTIFPDLIIDWHDGWWDVATFAGSEADIVHSVKVAMASLNSL